MYRFVDLSDAYWTSPDGSEGPLCAILNTSTDTFLKNSEGAHVLHDMDEVREAGGDRACSLVPDGFFDRRRRVVVSSVDYERRDNDIVELIAKRRAGLVPPLEPVQDEGGLLQWPERDMIARTGKGVP